MILAITGAQRVEIHCHGGRRVVQWIIDQFLANNVSLPSPLVGEGGEALRAGWGVLPSQQFEPYPPPATRRLVATFPLVGEVKNQQPLNVARLLQHAPTLRTAAILLDQLHGAFDNAVRHVLELLEANDASNYPVLLTEFSDLVRFAPIGRHLVEPWKVVVAGPPNVGKSSLVNALAGYHRAVVSEIAGTTRDVVSVQLAFDGWPVELTDTAGLRDAEGLEAEGIDRAKLMIAEADLVLWVIDGTAPQMQMANEDIPPTKLLAVINKADAIVGWGPDPKAGDTWGALLVSAKTGAGLPELVKWITTIFVPEPPPPGAAVPYMPELASNVTDAYLALVHGNGNVRVRAEAIRLLRDCLQSD
ncbi:MAG: 50S ribosome-binding GTPase [Planctomycetes bacterium]|nr:50S ribosome-binding GTPase [Planctomycetota bacterium]